jgi:hypothetical protein
MAAAACAAPSTTEPREIARTAHFRVIGAGDDAAIATTFGEELERNYSRILSDLRSDSLPMITLTLYRDHDRLARAVRPIIVPSWASGLATTQDQIHLMSPGVDGWGPLDRATRNAVHEFAHCVSLHENSTIANNPRWFWESVAIYEAGQFVDPRSLSYFKDSIPSLSTLNSQSNTFVYDLGFTVANYIVDRWGSAALSSLIKSNADLSGVLGVSQSELEQAWKADLRRKYP